MGDGFWHYSQCNQSGAPLYFCPDPPCPIGAPNDLTSPRLTLSANSLDVEYWVRNAYCNPPADGGDIHQPNQNYVNSYIFVYQINADDSIASIKTIAPYWEHGKATLTGTNPCARYQAVLRVSYLVGGLTFYQRASSKIAGPTGQDANGRSCLDDDRSCPVPITAAQPINIGSGNMRYDETLFSIQENTRPLVFAISYNSRNLTAGPLGIGYTHTFSETMKPLGGSPNRIQWINGRGEKTIFYSGDPGNVDFVAIWPADATGTVSLSGGVYTLKDLDGTLTKFGSTAGEWQSTEDRWGNRVFGAYTLGKLTSITDPENRVWLLVNDPTSGKLTTLRDPEMRDWSFSYDGSGRLQSIRDPLHPAPGNPWRQFSYVTGNPGEPTVLAEVQDDGLAVLEAHEYDSAGRAISSWSGDTVVTGGVPHPGANARSLVTLAYDSATQTIVTSKIDSTTNSVSTFGLTAPKGRFLPLSISGTCPSCGAAADLQTFVYDEFNRPTSKTIGSPPDAVQTNYIYNTNGLITTKTEAAGTLEERVTTYAYEKSDWPAFVTRVQEPSVANPPNFKTTTYSWGTGACAGFPGETCLETKVVGFLSSTASETHTTTTKFSPNPTRRVTSIAGPGTNQLTTMTYYGDDAGTAINLRGRLSSSAVQTSASPPTSLTTSFNGYDLFGTATSVVEPNGVETQRATDGRGRVTSSTSKKPAGDADEPGDYTTIYTYDPLRLDRLAEIRLPVLNKIQYNYEDGTNRLIDTIRVDPSGNQRERLHLTLNTIGGKNQEEAQLCTTPANPCSSGDWSTKRSDSFTYDIRNRLSAVVHPDATRIDYTYDSRGDLKDVKDERHTALGANTVYEYDPLDRLKKVTQKRPIAGGADVVTEYMYDKHGNLISVKDPKFNVTSYEYDDFDRMKKQTSPVTGVTTYSYDLADNLLTSTDANGATTTRTYDAANRLLSASSVRSGLPTELVTYGYDANEPPDEPNPPNPPKPHPKRYGKGRLVSISTTVGLIPSVFEQYSYERRGLLKKEWKTIDSNTYSLGYGYDANGNRTTMRYPSGRLVTYGFDFADRPSWASSPGTSYVDSAAYQPFGPESEIRYGNGSVKTMTFDLRYRPLTNTLVKSPTTISSQTYINDGVGNIQSIVDVDSNYSRNQLSYDDLNRLTTANSGASLWGTGSYNYDDLGSVNSLTVGSRMATFSYSGTTPKLTSVTENGAPRSVTYDPAGNETIVGSGTFSYSARNFLSTADGLTYTYDGRGLRVVTALSSTVYPISLRIDPSSVVGGAGGSATGTITLNAGAPANAMVSLKSSDTAVASFPVNPITIPQGQTSTSFSITTSPVAADTKVVISASYGSPGNASATRSEVLTVTLAPRLLLVSVSPRTVQTGGSVTGTVTLNGMASGPVTVTLTSSNPIVATVPASVQVSSGQASAIFSVTTCPQPSPPQCPVTASQAVTITATYLGASRWASLTVVPFAVQEMPREEFFAGREDGSGPLHLASLGSWSGTRGFLAGSAREREVSLFSDAPSLFGLTPSPKDFDEGGDLGPLRLMDGPIYSASGFPKRNFIYSPEINLLAESEVSVARERTILYEYIWFNGHPVA